MSKNQQNDQFNQIYGTTKENVEKMIEGNKDANDNEENLIGPSVGTIGDRSLNSIKDKFSKAGGQFLTV